MINKLSVICVYDLGATDIILHLDFQEHSFLLMTVLLEVPVKIVLIPQPSSCSYLVKNILFQTPSNAHTCVIETWSISLSKNTNPLENTYVIIYLY